MDFEPKIDPVHVKILAHRVSVINIIGLHEAEHHRDSLDHFIGQLVHDKEIHAFIFVVRLGQLTDADMNGIKWLQKVFGDKVTEFVIILFTYEQQEESESIIDDLKNNTVLEQLYKKCGSRYYTCNKIMNNQSELSKLMIGIEHLLFDNKQQGFTREMYNTELKKRRDKTTSEPKKRKYKDLISYTIYIVVNITKNNCFFLAQDQPTTIKKECHGTLYAKTGAIPKVSVKMWEYR